jgi:hypothetical protein
MPTPRTTNAVGLGKMMTVISDLNSYCFVEPARRVLDEALSKLEEIRFGAMWAEREIGRDDIAGVPEEDEPWLTSNDS